VESGSAEAVQSDRNRGKSQDVTAKDTPQAASAEPPVDQPTKIQIWTVQVASFVHEKDATSVAKKLTVKGYDVYVISADVSGKTYHRVQVGELKSRKDAAALQEALKTSEKFDQAFLVVR